MAVRTVWIGDAPAQVPHYYGTFSEIVAITGPNGAIGHPTDSKELLEYEDGEWGSIGATSKFPPAPGSPTNPFASVDKRTEWATANLATLRSGVTTAWGPGNVEYVWNGPLATDWAEKARVARWRRLPVANAIGDSQVQGGSGTADVGSWWETLMSLTPGVFTRGANYAVGGETSTQAIARLESAKSCDTLFIGFGQNNGLTELGVKQAFADMLTAIAWCEIRGIEPIIGLPPTTSSANAGAVTYFNVLKNGLEYIAMRKGIRCYNAFDSIIDPSNGKFLAEASLDGAHVQRNAIYAPVAATYQAWLAGLAPRIPLNRDPSLSGSGVVVPNSLFQVDSNADGLADGWSKLGECTTEIVTDDEILGNWQKITHTSGGSARVYATLVETIPVGNTVWWSCRAKWDFTVANSRVFTQAQGDNVVGGDGYLTDGPLWRGSSNGVLTGRGIVIGGAALNRIDFVVTGGYLQIAQPCALNLTKYGLANI